MERVVVIGSNSFSGSDFIDLLLERGGYEVHGVSRSPESPALFLPYKRFAGGPFTFHRFDLNRDLPRLMALLDGLQPAYVVNFAAQAEVAPSWEHPGQWFQTNAVALTEFVSRLARRDWLRRYVHISSPEVYGSCSGAVREDAPLDPSTPYAASKAAGDLSIFTFRKRYGFPFVMIRATNVYGPHQQLFKLVPRTFIRIRRREVLDLHGGGRAVKSYIHVRDVSRGEFAAMEAGRPGEIYHFSPDAGITVRALVRRMCALAGVAFDTAARDVAERPGQDAAYIIDSAKARAEFGWSPTIGLDAGLSGVLGWVDANWAEIERRPHDYRHRP